jgi:hypothetical protein
MNKREFIAAAGHFINRPYFVNGGYQIPTNAVSLWDLQSHFSEYNLTVLHDGDTVPMEKFKETVYVFVDDASMIRRITRGG